MRGRTLGTGGQLLDGGGGGSANTPSRTPVHIGPSAFLSGELCGEQELGSAQPRRWQPPLLVGVQPADRGDQEDSPAPFESFGPCRATVTGPLLVVGMG